jgi:4-amino-4-deoxy-L-arabinose transferase-like glycosyltransferase
MIAALFTIILILIFIALLINSKAFRWAVAIFVGVCVVGILLIISITEENKKKYEREEEVARHLMTTNDIELSDMTFNMRGGALNGRLRNKSTRYVVSEVGLRVIVEDCDASGCDTVGEKDARISESTPAGQARDFSESVYFSTSPTARRGRLNWHYQVTYVEAHRASNE